LVVIGCDLLAIQRRHVRVERAFTIAGGRDVPDVVGVLHRRAVLAPLDVALEHFVDDFGALLRCRGALASHDLEDVSSDEILPFGPPALQTGGGRPVDGPRRSYWMRTLFPVPPSSVSRPGPPWRT